MPNKVQVRFQVENDPFFYHEESRKSKVAAHDHILRSEQPRPHYLVDLEFNNLSKIYIVTDQQPLTEKKSDEFTVKIMAVVDRPCTCMKIYPYN